MPIIYNYNNQISPPAPLINVTVRSSEATDISKTSPALIDTGADYTVITKEIDDLAAWCCLLQKTNLSQHPSFCRGKWCSSSLA